MAPVSVSPTSRPIGEKRGGEGESENGALPSLQRPPFVARSLGAAPSSCSPGLRLCTRPCSARASVRRAPLLLPSLCRRRGTCWCPRRRGTRWCPRSSRGARRLSCPWRCTCRRSVVEAHGGCRTLTKGTVQERDPIILKYNFYQDTKRGVFPRNSRLGLGMQIRINEFFFQKTAL